MTDLPPVALEESDGVEPPVEHQVRRVGAMLGAFDAAESEDERRKAIKRIDGYLYGAAGRWRKLRNILALAREALALRERVAALNRMLDTCQEGHTHQAKRAEAAQAEAARLRVALGEIDHVDSMPRRNRIFCDHEADDMVEGPGNAALIARRALRPDARDAARRDRGGA